MLTRYKLIVTLTVISTLVAGCRRSEPTATPVPPTNTPVTPIATPSAPPSSTMTMTATAVATAPELSATPTEAPPAPSATPTTRPGYFSREQLIEDARQLADTIERTHPDPYTRGGGKIAYHRRLQRLLNAIPKEGMTKNEFIRLLRPFVAAVRDSHTYLHYRTLFLKKRVSG
jgi:hypothetical protein